VAAVGVKGPGGLEVGSDEERPAVPAGRLLLVGAHATNASVVSLETERAVSSALLLCQGQAGDCTITDPVTAVTILLRARGVNPERPRGG
jgi:hypothetical protein